MPEPPKSPEHLALGRAMRQLRDERGLSQESLAYESGIHRTYIGRLERGELNASYGQLLKIAMALSIRLSELIILGEELGDTRSERSRRARRA